MMNVCIIGVGLIGGSLGMALRRVRRAGRRAYHVTGFGRSIPLLKEAKRRGAVDAFYGRLPDAVKDADVVVLSIPVEKIVAFARKLRPLLKPGAVLTDVGSVKKKIVSRLRSPNFVGGHPIAGSEKNGVKNAKADLFGGAVCVVTRDHSSKKALALVARMWRDTGAKIVTSSAAEHDRTLALTSHLPHLLAFSLFGLGLRSSARSKAVHMMSGPSFHDMTRIAASSPGIWTGIFSMNRAELNKHVREFVRQLNSLLRKPAPSLYKSLAQLSAAKRAW